VIVEIDSDAEIGAPPGWQLGALVARGGSAIVHAVQRNGAGTGPPFGGTAAILKRGRWFDRDAQARFAHEANVLQAIGPPLAPALYASGAIDGWPYLVLEFVPGEPLSGWMSRTGDRGGIGQILAILVRIADALAQLHDRHVVHRDVKPENLLVGAGGVRLIDFGLAVLTGYDDHASPSADAAAGTLHYMAPEQIAGANVDHRADLYSLGVVAFEMIAGVPPFVGERRAIDYQHRCVRAPSLRELRDVPVALSDLVAACLAKQPDARPADARAVRSQLARAFEGITTLRGMGGRDAAVGRYDTVALVWLDGGDVVAGLRAINDVGGVVLRRRGDALVAGFAAIQHDAPVAVAMSLFDRLADRHRQLVVHAASLLVRRTPQGKLAIYGAELDAVDEWVPSAPFQGAVATAAAEVLAPRGVFVAAADLPGMFRPHDGREPASGGDGAVVGRDRLVTTIVDATDQRGRLIWLAGAAGLGKSRVLAAVASRLRERGREVVALSGRRRFVGEPPDDDRVLAALYGGRDAAAALVQVGARNAVVLLDDFHWFAAAIRRAVVDPARGATCVVAAPEPPETDGLAGVSGHVLEPLATDAVARLVRDLLHPAAVPEGFAERLARRTRNVPGVLAHLIRDLADRGALGRDWRVTDAELDALDAADPATRALARIPGELADLVEAASALGPRFTADELAAVVGGPGVRDQVDALVHGGVFGERAGWYEFVEPRVQDAVQARGGNARAVVHDRALAYWLAHPLASRDGWLARVAHHAAGAGQREVAAACWLALARLDSGHHAETRALIDAAFEQLVGAVPPEIGPMLAEVRTSTHARV
jgi:hypothetical protein